MLQNQGLGLDQGAASQRSRKEYRCDEIDPLTGQYCNAPFTRLWNLKRHKLELHGDKDPVFINYITSPAIENPAMGNSVIGNQLPRIQALDLPPSTIPMQGPVAAQSSSWRPAPSKFSPSPYASWTSPSSPPSLPPIPPPRVPAPAFSLSLPEKRIFRSYPRTSNIPDTPVQVIHQSRNLAQSTDPVITQHSHLASGLEDQFLQSDAIENPTSSPTGWTGQLEQDSESDNATEASEHTLASVLRTSDEGSGCSCKKWKRSTATGRVIDADLRADVPVYLVKRSKKILGQQRGLGWLSVEGKAHFESTLERLLAQWGVKAKHRGTCVLIPEDWKALDPIDLMAIFDDHQLPSGGSSRAWYSYSDHATTIARAAAWYGEWPRRGVELDNFLGCGPFKPKDGSHLCHQEHCIVHLVYESAAVNWDRRDCSHEALFLRQDGREVPESCTKHSPPCLMQVSNHMKRCSELSTDHPKHAALTTREAYYIQFAVFRQAKGIPPTLPIPRPRRY